MGGVRLFDPREADTTVIRMALAIGGTSACRSVELLSNKVGNGWAIELAGAPEDVPPT